MILAHMSLAWCFWGILFCVLVAALSLIYGLSKIYDGLSMIVNAEQCEAGMLYIIFGLASISICCLCVYWLIYFTNNI